MTSLTFFLVFIPLLAIILLAINLIFAPHNSYQEKNSVFECGFHSFLGQNRTQFNISFFIFALLFLLFDLEILLVYPYVVSAYVNSLYGLTVMLIFFLALTLGFAYEIGKGALKLSSKQNNLKDISKNTSDTNIISFIKNKLIMENKRNYLNSIIKSNGDIIFVRANWLSFNYNLYFLFLEDVYTEINVDILNSPGFINYLDISDTSLFIITTITSIILLMEETNQAPAEKTAEKELLDLLDKNPDDDDVDFIKWSVASKVSTQMNENLTNEGRPRRKTIYDKINYSEGATLDEIDKEWLHTKFLAQYSDRYMLRNNPTHGMVLVSGTNVALTKVRALYPSARLLAEINAVRS